MYPYYTPYQLLRTGIVARAAGLGEFSHNVTNAEIGLGPVLSQERGTGKIDYLERPTTGLVGMGRAGGPAAVITPAAVI